jgi:hypothetical protein
MRCPQHKSVNKNRKAIGHLTKENVRMKAGRSICSLTKYKYNHAKIRIKPIPLPNDDRWCIDDHKMALPPMHDEQ